MCIRGSPEGKGQGEGDCEAHADNNTSYIRNRGLSSLPKTQCLMHQNASHRMRGSNTRGNSTRSVTIGELFLYPHKPPEKDRVIRTDVDAQHM